MSKYVLPIQVGAKLERHYFSKKRDAIRFAKEVGADRRNIKAC